jgi:8-oxo-dGTP pyrophosphatase MutT (NUDIX family)
MFTFPEFCQLLTTALQGPLPGEQAHNRLSWFKRLPYKDELTLQPSYKQSAVLILLWPQNDSWRCLLIRRPDYEGVHSGQMAFPGGRKEEGDVSIMQTAIRETWEEIGVQISENEIVGALSPLYIPVSNFLVYPFVACASSKPVFNPAPEEVQELVDFDLFELLDETKVKKKERLMKPGLKAEAPYYDIEGHEVWGATGMMLSELSDVLRSFISS